jgi:hypothetical protein
METCLTPVQSTVGQGRFGGRGEIFCLHPNEISQAAQRPKSVAVGS